MAAVRCAATRIGVSLLQRRQAAVAEEGRRFAPSRLMRSRGLSSEIPKEEEVPSWADLRKRMRKLEEDLKKTRRVEAVETLIVGSAKFTVFCMVAAAAFDGDGVEAKAVTKANQ